MREQAFAAGHPRVATHRARDGSTGTGAGAADFSHPEYRSAAPVSVPVLLSLRVQEESGLRVCFRACHTGLARASEMTCRKACSHRLSCNERDYLLGAVDSADLTAACCLAISSINSGL